MMKQPVENETESIVFILLKNTVGHVGGSCLNKNRLPSMQVIRYMPQFLLKPSLDCFRALNNENLTLHYGGRWGILQGLPDG